MVKYEYRPELEVFKRVDNRGPALKFNIVEGRRIKSMLELGYKIPTIFNKIDWANDDVTLTKLRTFVDNLQNGNISLDGDYPEPQKKVIPIETRVNELEKRMNDMESRFSEIRNDCFISAFAAPKKDSEQESNNIMDKVKSWLEF